MDTAFIELTRHGAAEAARRIASGEITSEMLIRACLDHIEAREGTVKAWHYLDPAYALEQARKADEWRSAGRSTGPLHGVPVAIKDIIDTKDMPTENGSPYFKGRRRGEDAAVVAALRDAGAIILGKTVTTELAFFHPGKTCNPHSPEHTPGGSSSGSAAAVADHMVPLALGTQTAGSVIRPAAYCGVFGFKPTFGLISRRGILAQSSPLDTVGLFTRSIEDLAFAAECLTAFDPRDGGMWPRSRPRLVETALQDPPLEPLFAYVKGPAWDKAEPVTKEAFAELAEFLGDRCDEVELPEVFADGLKWQRQIQFADIAKNYGPLVDKAPDAFSDVLKETIEEGRRVLAKDYNLGRDYQEVLNAGVETIFERYNAILTPTATGAAPKGLQSTGNPVFCRLWTYLGVPAVTLPLLEVDGLPMGVQLVGRRYDDGRLLRTAQWLTRLVEENKD